MRSLRSASLVLALACVASAQQTGDANRNYAINGIGNNATSLVNTTVYIQPMVNTYSTMDPNTNVFWLASANANPGQLLVPPNSVDIGTAAIGFSDVSVLGDGNGPGLFNAFFRTNALGSFGITLQPNAAMAATQVNLCFGHFSALSAASFFVSQTHHATFNASTVTTLSLTDDSNVLVNIGFPLTYYAHTYTQFYVGSNGYVTFNAGDTTLGESILGMTGSTTAIARPRISMWWDDLNPTVNPAVASITVISDNASNVSVNFTNIAEYATTNSNTFGFAYDNLNMTCTLNYGAMASIDGLVGMTPGTTGAVTPYVPAVGTPVVLNAGPTAVPAGNAWYQLFTVGPSIVANTSHTISFDATMNPILVN